MPPLSIFVNILNCGFSSPHLQGGRTPISWAAFHNQQAIVTLLIACPGVDVNLADTVRFLLFNGAEESAQLQRASRSSCVLPALVHLTCIRGLGDRLWPDLRYFT